MTYQTFSIETIRFMLFQKVTFVQLDLPDSWEEQVRDKGLNQEAAQILRLLMGIFPKCP